ncbi:hypothetical protein ACFQY4_24135 [Catellatospora bangladeshensis]|uniref:hypothetical protein n=1 Tax=Catellatospora bangladeshensis TaxID=310355 RepID=UPI00361B1827
MATSANRLDRYPVDEHGNLEHYPSSVHTWQGRVVDNGQLWSAGNEPFAAELTFVDGRRGAPRRSSNGVTRPAGCTRCS